MCGVVCSSWCYVCMYVLVDVMLNVCVIMGVVCMLCVCCCCIKCMCACNIDLIVSCCVDMLCGVLMLWV